MKKSKDAHFLTLPEIKKSQNPQENFKTFFYYEINKKQKGNLIL
jgi:hypothetical protein